MDDIIAEGFLMQIGTIGKLAILKRQINFEGYNMSLINNSTNNFTYLATIDQQNTFDSTPGAYNHFVYLLELDMDFNILNSTILQPNIKSTNFRLLSNKFFTADTEQEIPKKVLCEYNYSDGEIINVKPMADDIDTKHSNNNILVIKHLETQNIIHTINSINPLKVFKFNITTGESSLISMKRIFQTNDCEVVPSASLYLHNKKKYLVILHVYKENIYMMSHWITLNELYTYDGVSQSFRFEPYNVSNPQSELCMSILLKDDNTIICPVSFGTNNVIVYGFNVDSVLRTIVD